MSDWQRGAEGDNPERITLILDGGAPELVRLVIGLAKVLDVYDPEAGDFNAEWRVFQDLPGGVGLVDLSGWLSEGDLATLREVLDCAVDVRREAR